VLQNKDCRVEMLSAVPLAEIRELFLKASYIWQNEVLIAAFRWQNQKDNHYFITL